MKALYETKRLKYSFTIAIVFWLLVKTFAGSPLEVKDYVKTIEKEFAISSDGTVHIENKYGEVNITTWSKNEVTIKIEITVDSKNEKNAQQTLDNIQVNFENTDSFVKAVTEINSKSKSSSWFKWGKDKNEKFKINYSVSMPVGAELELHNKYGNVVVDRLNNDCRLFVKYGNFNADKVEGDLDLHLGYGKGELLFAKSISGEIKYSELKVEEVKDFEIDSKYSKINIGGGDFAKIQSRYDNYTVDKISDFNIDTKYTEILIDQLINSAIMNVAYGGVEIKDLKSGFSSIQGESKYTGFEISTSGGASYTFDLNTKYGHISVPSDSELNYESSGDKMETRKGTVGNSSSLGNISITSKYGNITIH